MIANQQTTEAAGYSSRREIWFVLGCCLLAAARVFIFSAAAPFSADDDERAHFDLTYKYARGWLPNYDRTKGYNDNFDPEPAYLTMLYGTLEYYVPAERFPGGQTPPPNWRLPPNERQAHLKPLVQFLTQQANHEALSPPIYYLVGAAWLNLGRWLGIAGGPLIYWLRFISVPIYLAMICLAFLFCRKFFPDDEVMRQGIPLLLAVFPQDAFYLITNDVLSPLLFLAAFMLLMTLLDEKKSVRYCLYTGVAVAATFLVKLSNIAVLALFAMTLVWLISRRIRNENKAVGWRPLAALAVAAGLPIAAWVTFNRVVFGDWLAVKEKAAMLGWTVKPFAQWFAHPIFTPSGFWTFTSDLIRTFWRGEMQWHRVTVAWPAADWLYVVSTLLLLAGSLILVLRRQPETASHPRRLLGLCWIALAVSFFFLVYSSIRHDWGGCAYPSRAYPYMSSGRLIAGVMVPFLVLYLRGLEYLLSPFRRWLNPMVVVAVIALVALVSEIFISTEIFGSAYNWFHLPR